MSRNSGRPETPPRYAPRTAKSAYQFFLIKKHDEVREKVTKQCAETRGRKCKWWIKNRTKMEIHELGLPELWRGLSSTDRARYEHLAHQDRDRVAKELAAFNPVHISKPHSALVAHRKILRIINRYVDNSVFPNFHYKPAPIDILMIRCVQLAEWKHDWERCPELKRRIHGFVRECCAVGVPEVDLSVDSDLPLCQEICATGHRCRNRIHHTSSRRCGLHHVRYTAVLNAIEEALKPQVRCGGTEPTGLCHRTIEFVQFLAIEPDPISIL